MAMAAGGRTGRAIVLGLAGGALVLTAGCSRLQSTFERKDSVTLGDLATRVAALEQQVADLQAATAGQTPVEGQVDQQAGAALGGQSEAAAVRPQDAMLAEGSRAVVTASFLNVRRSPDQESERVGVLKEGAAVTVVSREGDWVRIRAKNGDQTIAGWVMGRYLASEPN